MAATKKLFGEKVDLKEKDESNPHVIDDSKDEEKEGKNLEKLMFEDPCYVKVLLDVSEDGITPQSEKSERHKILEELIKDKGEHLETVKTCRYCGEEKVKIFSIRFSDGISTTPEFTCCEKEDCIEKMLSGTKRNSVQIERFQFSVLRKLQRSATNWSDFKKVIELFRWAFGVSWRWDEVRLTNKTAFGVFFQGGRE